MDTFLYFAYGSNMCEGRLRAKDRAPSAKFVVVAKLVEHRLKWHKRSCDGSGKADAYYTGCGVDFVLGVVFRIRCSEKAALDKAEALGQGYAEKCVTVHGDNGQDYPAVTYVAAKSHIDSSLKPYCWYKRFVVDGAKQHNLEPGYCKEIESQPAKKDPCCKRETEESAIQC